MKTVFVLRSGSPSDYLPVIKMFEAAGWNTTNGSGDIDLVCFTGGSDVSPHLYGEENIASHCDPVRDEYEREVYEAFVGRAPMVGICRGGQFLNVMNSGKMIQDISGHSMGIRPVIVDQPKGGYNAIGPLPLHEDHHQGMIQTEYAETIGWDPRDHNCEICYYPETRCLCFQPHPEWGHEPTRKLFFDLMGEYLDV